MATIKVPVSSSDQRVTLNAKEGMRVNDHMRRHNMRFRDAKEIRAFLSGEDSVVPPATQANTSSVRAAA